MASINACHVLGKTLCVCCRGVLLMSDFSLEAIKAKIIGAIVGLITVVVTIIFS